MVLPYINMNPPQVYTCSPSWTPLPPPSPYHPSGSSPCTSPKHPVSCIELGLTIRFLYDITRFNAILPNHPTLTAQSKPERKTPIQYTNAYMEKAMALHSSTLAWKIPQMEAPGRRQFIGSLRVRHDERLPFHFSLSCTGEGNGNPLQYSCLENPRGGGAWWAAVYGVAQSRTWLKWLSSSNNAYIWNLERW